MITNGLPANCGTKMRYEWKTETEGYCVDDCDFGSNQIIASVFGYRNLLVRMHLSIYK